MMELLIVAAIFLVILVSLFLYAFSRQPRHVQLANLFPGPPAIPYLGNALLFAGIDHNEMMQVISELQFKYGSPAKIWFGPHLVISVADHKSMEIIMKSTDNLNKSVHHRYFGDFMKGVFLATDDRWRKLRKMVNSMFHSSLMEGHIQIFNNESETMCNILEQRVGKGVFDVKNSVNDCILDIICQTAMKTPMNVQLKSNPRFTYHNDVSHLSEIIMQRVSKIWLYPNVIFSQTKLGKERDVLVKKIKNFVKSVVRRRKEIKERTEKNDVECNAKKHNKPYLDMMLEYGKEDSLTEDELAFQINDLLVAGSDTSAVAISYAMVMLGIDQNFQNRVYAELREIFGDSNRPATMEDLALMTQLDMVIKETIRITCPPHMARTVEKDIKLDGDKVIPAGATLYMLLYTLHRQPQYWAHPDEFYPDHFLPEIEEARPKYSFLPFSYGLRICPGHKYGVYSLKVVLSAVLRRFRIVTELKSHELKYRVAIMLELANGYPIRLEHRNPNNASLHNNRY